MATCYLTRPYDGASYEYGTGFNARVEVYGISGLSKSDYIACVYYYNRRGVPVLLADYDTPDNYNGGWRYTIAIDTEDLGEGSKTLFAEFTHISGRTEATSGEVTITITEPAPADTWYVGQTLTKTVTTSVDSGSLTVEEGEVVRIRLTFSSPGLYTFYSTGSSDTYGFLSTSTGFNEDSGAPTSYLVRNDDGGDDTNFALEYDVQDTSVSYYLFVRHYDFDESGSFRVYVKKLWKQGWTEDLGTISSPVSRYLSFGISGFVAYAKVKFSQSGTVTFFTDGDMDTYGYLSETNALDQEKGGPVTDLVSDDDGGTGVNCRFTYEIVAGKTYYFWVRPWGVGTTGTTTFYIDFEVKKLWYWDRSNGSATDAQTLRAYEVISEGGRVPDFSHLVWNDLCDVVKAVLASKSKAWLNTYATYDNTRMTASPYKLTAVKFNSLRINVDQISSTGIGLKTKYSGTLTASNKVLGSEIITLGDSVNRG